MKIFWNFFSGVDFQCEFVRISDNFQCFGTDPSSFRGPDFTPGLDVGYSCLNLLHSWLGEVSIEESLDFS